MIRITSVLFTLLIGSPVLALNDTQFDAVKGLGKLNGIALNCQYLDETRRMKRAVVETVPKLRVIGEAFDQSTNQAFLQMIHDRTPCPSERTLSEQVDNGIITLQQQFIVTPPLLKP